MSLLKYLPGLDSYRGRYLYLSALAFIIFCSFAIINWSYINDSSQQTSQNIIKRQENSLALEQIISQYQLIRIQIYQFSLNPEQVSPITINDSIIHLLDLTSNLDIRLYDNIDAEVFNNFIFQIPIKLHELTLDFLRTRTNPDLWIPAIRVMTEELLPVNTEIIILLDELIDAVSQDEDESSKLKNSLLKFKVTWLSTIAEFRLLASNRMGIFDTSANSIDSRVANIELYINIARKQLAEIETMLSKPGYQYLREQLFTELKQHIDQWMAIHKKAKSLLLNRDWRSDIPALVKIDRLLDEFNKTFTTLTDELQEQSVKDVQSLNDNNRAYSLFFLILGILLLIILTLIYFYIDRNVLLPIAQTTRALLLQSQGISQELLTSTKTAETRQLIEAFNMMREQINHRENRLDYMAHHDNLTHLPNRLVFNERLEHAIRLTDRGGKQVALMLLDLDRFKLVNDTLGHVFGDKLLQQTAQRLKECMRAEDTIARLGGDEFAIILENIRTTKEVDSFARKIINLFQHPFYIDAQEIFASTSIGIAISPSDTNEATSLIRFADVAMYESKNRGRNQFTFFTQDLEDSEQSIINFENMLRDALEKNEFELHYQPIIDSDKKNSLISEAFLRWNHPARGLLMPIDFLPVLDNPELLFDLTRWVISKAQNFQLKAKQILNIIPVISINLPSEIFQQKHYRKKLQKILLNDIQHPDCFILEITEITLLADMMNTAQLLQQIHNAGFRIALDDFGSGQSSLSHLHSFPIDTLKIDREIIRDILQNQSNANLVSAIISLGQELGISVIAEGVENQRQHDFLVKKGAYLFQGFHFFRPMDADEYLKLLKSYTE